MSAHARHLDRHLRELQADQRAVAPRWRELLHRVFGGDEQLSDEQKAELLGVPSRRQVLRIGGISIAGAALLAACTDDDVGDDTQTTAPLDEDDDTDDTDEPAGDREIDVVLANTAISLEILAIDTYQFALDSGMLETGAARDAVALFQAHHGEHLAVLSGVVEAAGAAPYATANAIVKAAVIDPLLFSATSERDVIRLAHDLEQAAAQTYVHAATSLSTADLRSTAAAIAGIESRHAALLDLIGELSNDTFAAYPSDNPLPQDAMVTG